MLSERVLFTAVYAHLSVQCIQGPEISKPVPYLHPQTEQIYTNPTVHIIEQKCDAVRSEHGVPWARWEGRPRWAGPRRLAARPPRWLISLDQASVLWARKRQLSPHKLRGHEPQHAGVGHMTSAHISRPPGAGTKRVLTHCYWSYSSLTSV